MKIAMGQKFVNVEEFAKWATNHSPGTILRYGPGTKDVSVPASGVFFTLPEGMHAPQTHLSTHTPPMERSQASLRLWYFAREAWRAFDNSDIYGILYQLWHLPQFASFMPRPCMSDPTKVEFFLDEAGAIADRPVVSTMAKFLRKVSILYSDTYIRDVDAEYRAAASTELEILTGQEAFREAYFSGPSSCMSKRFHDRDNYEGHHPVDAYDVPGMGIAVKRDGGGNINARCIVYVNPDKPDDKRAVRVYGDSALSRRLKLNGFQFRSLHGVKLKSFMSERLTLDFIGSNDKRGRKVYVAPYMDGPEGNHGSADAARCLVKLKGEDYLTVINDNAQMWIRSNVVENGSSSPNSEGLIYLTEVDPEALVMVCPATGKKFDILSEDSLPQFESVWHDGKIVQMIVSEEARAMYPAEVRGFAEGRGVQMVRYALANPPPTFEHGGIPYIESDSMRCYLGFTRLSSRYYPESPWEMARYQDNRTTTHDGQVILTADSAQVITLYPGTQREDRTRQLLSTHSYHRSEITETTDLVRVHSDTRGKAVYARPDVYTVKTVTGRTVVPGYHSVGQDALTGKWMFTRGMQEVNSFFGTTLWFSGPKMTMREVRYTSASFPFREMFAARSEDMFKIVRQYYHDNWGNWGMSRMDSDLFGSVWSNLKVRRAQMEPLIYRVGSRRGNEYINVAETYRRMRSWVNAERQHPLTADQQETLETITLVFKCVRIAREAMRERALETGEGFGAFRGGVVHEFDLTLPEDPYRNPPNLTRADYDRHRQEQDAARAAEVRAHHEAAGAAFNATVATGTIVGNMVTGNTIAGGTNIVAGTLTANAMRINAPTIVPLDQVVWEPEPVPVPPLDDLLEEPVEIFDDLDAADE